MVVIFSIADAVPSQAPPHRGLVLRLAPGNVPPMASDSMEVHRISESIAVAQVYDPQVKADLFATALTVSSGLYLIDPFPLQTDALAQLMAGRDIVGVVVTNENHLRASAELAARFSAPIFADQAAGVVGSLPPESLPDELRVVRLPGAPLGEIALHCPSDGGTLVMGDALIHFGSHGFTFLPAKYCTDAKQMRKSLHALLELEFERMLFAHGTPILRGARARLAALLNE